METKTEPSSPDGAPPAQERSADDSAPATAKPDAKGVPQPGEEFQVALGQRVPLTASVDITFTGNSHKLSEGNVDSTVGVSFTVHHPDRDESWDEWIDTDRPSTFAFTIAEIDVEMVDYLYDGWIRLRIK